MYVAQLCVILSAYTETQNKLKYAKYLIRVAGLRIGCVCSYADASMAPWSVLKNSRER